MRTLVIATQNRNKFQEMWEALAGTGWELRPASDFPGLPEIEEDGRTLEENSLKKARIVAGFTGFSALSDDTGLFVDALGGQPGIYAARFAGEGCSYGDNVRKLLDLMKEVPTGGRNALFRTVVTLYHPDGHHRQVAGEVQGEILEAPRGSAGFGYDPVLRPSLRGNDPGREEWDQPPGFGGSKSTEVVGK
jgi:XTP/dITP diphosphohydrolase